MANKIFDEKITNPKELKMTREDEERLKKETCWICEEKYPKEKEHEHKQGVKKRDCKIWVMFLDSFQFALADLDCLVKTLDDEDFKELKKHFETHWKHTGR